MVEKNAGLKVNALNALETLIAASPTVKLISVTPTSEKDGAGVKNVTMAMNLIMTKVNA